MDVQLNISRKSKPGSCRHKRAVHERCQLSLLCCESLVLKDNSSAETTIKKKRDKWALAKEEAEMGREGLMEAKPRVGRQ